MRVSIITVVFNGKHTIAHAIKSVLSQSYSNIDYIVIDGQSTDGTQQIIAHFADKLRWVSEPDKGIYDAMNKGINLAEGEIIGFLNADDFYSSSTIIEDIVRMFRQKQTDALYGDLAYVDASDVDKVTRFWKAGEYKQGSFLYGWMPPHPTFFVRRDVYRRYGLFNLSFQSAADYELMLRFIHKHHISLQYLPLVMVLMRRGGKSNVSLKNRIAANIEDRQAWKVNKLSPYIFTIFLKPLRKVWQFVSPITNPIFYPVNG